MKQYFTTQLTEEECLNRLDKKLVRFVGRNWKSDCYVGKIKKNRFKFYYHEGNTRNKLNIYAVGKIKSMNENTTLITIDYSSTLVSYSYYLFYFILLFLIFTFLNMSKEYQFDLYVFLEAFLGISAISTIIGVFSLPLKRNKDRKTIIELFLRNELKLTKVKKVPR